MKIGTRKDRELAAYYRDMNFYLFLNKLKVKVFPNNNSAKYPGCPGMPGVRDKRKRNKAAKVSRKANRR